MCGLATNGYVANFAGAGVGTNIAVTVSGLSLTGSAAGNYSLGQPTGLSGEHHGGGGDDQFGDECQQQGV